VSRTAEVGTEKLTESGYWMVKLATGKWELKHRIIAAETLGRPLKPGERVVFKDSNRENLDPENLFVVVKDGVSPNLRLLQKKLVKLEQLVEEIEDLKALVAAEGRKPRTGR
jgi:non-ribosomal peptide synthetase component E (peptide arylation enzyme)